MSTLAEERYQVISGDCKKNLDAVMASSDGAQLRQLPTCKVLSYFQKPMKLVFRIEWHVASSKCLLGCSSTYKTKVVHNGCKQVNPLTSVPSRTDTRAERPCCAVHDQDCKREQTQTQKK